MKPYYEAGGITLYCGDCREVLPALEVAADLVLTDPPYGIGYGGSQSVGGTPGRKKAYWRTYQTAWDEERVAPETIRLVVGLAPAVVVWGGQFYSDVLPPSGGWLIWDKTQREMSFGDAEMAWTNVINTIRILSLNRVHVAVDGKAHPAQKPLRLMAWCLQKAKLSTGALVIDPFAGSGTTLRAAKDAGLRSIGIESNEAYCETAARRLEQGVFAWDAPQT